MKVWLLKSISEQAECNNAKSWGSQPQRWYRVPICWLRDNFKNSSHSAFISRLWFKVGLPGLTEAHLMIPALKCLQINRDSSECMLSHFSRVWFFVTPGTIRYQAPLSMGFSKQEYCSGLPFPSLGDLPDPGIKPRPLALQADSLPAEPPRKPLVPKTIFSQ